MNSSTLTCFASLVAGSIPNDPAKTPKDKLEFRGKLMHLHESVGLLMLGAMCTMHHSERMEWDSKGGMIGAEEHRAEERESRKEKHSVER